MRLLHGTLRPGRVIEVLDGGNIKVDAPGLFSREDKEALPPVMPWFGLHANTYSEPKLEDEVWVMNFTDNPMQLFWFRKDDRTGHNDAIEGETNVEVICNREAGSGYATIYFSDGSGWMFKNGDSLINIREDGSIILNPNMSNRVVHLCQDSISLGSEGGSAHPAGYGDETINTFNIVVSTFQAIANAASSNAMTSPIAAAINAMLSNLQSAIPKIKSENVTLD